MLKSIKGFIGEYFKSVLVLIAISPLVALSVWVGAVAAKVIWMAAVHGWGLF